MGVIRSFKVILIVAFLSFLYDINVNGSYKSSKTRSLLNQFGILKQVETAAANFRLSSQQAYRWGQKNVPVYIAKARAKFVPFLVKVKDAIIKLVFQIWANIQLLFQYVVDKKPAVQQWVDQHAPGFWDKSADWLRQASAVVTDLFHQLIVLIRTACQWLKENVFTGSLSPENLQRGSIQALHLTQHVVGSAMNWLSDIVTSGSKMA